MLEKMEIHWYDKQSYIKYKRSLIGRYDLEKDEPINEDENGNLIFPPLIPVELMGIEVRKSQLQWCEDKHEFLEEVMGIDFDSEDENEWNKGSKDFSFTTECQRCRNQTKEFLKNVKEKCINPWDTPTNCTNGCSWFDYYQEKRDKVITKYQVEDENFDDMINSL